MKAFIWISLIIVFLLIAFTGNATTSLEGLWDLTLVNLDTGESESGPVILDANGCGWWVRGKPVFFDCKKYRLERIEGEDAYYLYLLHDSILGMVREDPLPDELPEDRWAGYVAWIVQYYDATPIGKLTRISGDPPEPGHLSR